jgi:hypothetical protein
MDHALQTCPQQSSQSSAPGQRRFNTLLRQIEQAQQRLAAWQTRQGAVEHLHTMMVHPLQNQVFALQRKWVFGMDRIAHWADWTDAESDTLRQQLCQACMELLLRDAQDADIQRLFARYSDTDFASERARMVRMVTPLPQQSGTTGHALFQGSNAAAGAGTGSGKDVDTELDGGVAGQRRLSKKQLAARLLAQVRREQETLQLTHAARDLYRKLVSELHPDREPDPALRSVKTDLMQKANHAYAHNDVFALLGLQAQADENGVRPTGGLMPERIRYFNKLLTGQLASLKSQIEAMEGSVLGKLGLPLQTRCNPNQCEALVKLAVRHWRKRREQLLSNMQRIGSQGEAKGWLRDTRQAQFQQVVRRLVAL